MLIDRNQWWRSPIVLVGITGLALLLRFVALDADPHWVVQKGVIYDAGEYQKNARQLVLFDRWRFDDYNPELDVAPVHAVILAGEYRVFGVGFWQMVLPQALGGLLTAILVYLLTRETVNERAARVAFLVQATCLFAIGHDRSGFIESLQLLFVVAMIYFGLRAVRRPWLGLVGGVFAAASVLTKPTALVMGLVMIFGWVGLRLEARRDPARPPFRWAGPICFSAVAAVILGLVFATVTVHVLPEIRQFFELAAGGVFDGGSRAAQYVRTELFGIGLLGMSLNRFFVATAGLEIVVAWFAARRILGVVEDRISLVERVAWVWLGLGLLFLSVQHYQPARRFLLFIPPLALLAGLALATTARTAERPPWQRGVAGFMLGGVLGFLLGDSLGGPVDRFLTEASGHSISLATARTAIWSAFAIGCPLVAWLMPRWFSLVVGKAPLALVLGLTIAADLVQMGGYLVHPSRTLEAASQSLNRLTAGWPENRRRMFGGEANALAIETNLVAYGQAPSDGDWTRYRPTLLSKTEFAGAPATAIFPGHPDFRLCRVLGLGPWVDGALRYQVALYIAEDRLSECLAWAAAEPDPAAASNR